MTRAARFWLRGHRNQKRRRCPPRGRPLAVAIRGYDAFLAEVPQLLDGARRASARTVNAVITFTYWEIGRRIVNVQGKRKEISGQIDTDNSAGFARQLDDVAPRL